MNVTVITNSLPILNLLAEYDSIQLVSTGGIMRRSDRSLIGHLMETSLGEIRADKLILGIQGIHIRNGLTNEQLIETQTDRKLMRFANHVIVVADHTKFGITKASFVDAVKSAHTIVTDDRAPRDMVERIRALGVEVIVARATGQRAPMEDDCRETL